MGFALLETLPAGAQKFVLKHKDKKLLPVNIPATYRENFLPKKGFHLPFTSKFIKINSEWIAQPYSNSSEEANLVALGEYSADFEKKQERLIEQNKKLVSDISLLSSTDRIKRIATDELGMHKAETKDIVRVDMNGDKK